MSTSDNTELHQKILGFLGGEFARKEGRQCVAVDLDFSPGNGFRDEPIRKWVRSDEPDLFENLSNVENLVKSIIEIAEGEANAKPPGKHRFVVRTHQHLSGRATMSFALSPTFTGGGDETALVTSGGGGGGRGSDMVLHTIANHANQHARINAQMFDGALRAMSQSNMKLHDEIAEMRAENFQLRRENDELKSTKMDREFQYAMAAEKNARSNAAFQKVLQLGTVVAAKIAGGDEGSGSSSPLAMMIGELYTSLRQDQMQTIMGVLDMGQKILFMELVKMAAPPQGPSEPGSLPTGGPVNGKAPGP